MLNSEQGFTIIESLIAMAIVGIVLTGIHNLAISSSQLYVAQNAVVQMQADGRAAMEFMTRELRLLSGNPTISTTVTDNDTIRFNRVEDIGYASGWSATTLTDNRKAWQPGAFDPSQTSAFTLTIVNGTGSGQARSITGNSATQLTVGQDWGITPDASSRYIITSDKRFARTSATDNILRYRIGATGDNNPLAENITYLRFLQPDPNSITIELTARTKDIDPIKKQYRYYNLSETVRRRN